MFPLLLYLYYSTLCAVCQEFFEIFLRFFSTLGAWWSALSPPDIIYYNRFRTRFQDGKLHKVSCVFLCILRAPGRPPAVWLIPQTAVEYALAPTRHEYFFLDKHIVKSFVFLDELVITFKEAVEYFGGETQLSIFGEVSVALAKVLILAILAEGLTAHFEGVANLCAVGEEITPP